MAKLIIRSFRGDRVDPTGIACEDPSLAVQASKDECDINNIIAKYLRTGELPGARQGVYADMSQMTNLQDAIHLVNDAMQSFMELPADIRRFFDNDPTKLVAFAEDPRNAAKAIELGLATARPLPPGASPPAPGQGAPDPKTPGKGSELPTT